MRLEAGTVRRRPTAPPRRGRPPASYSPGGKTRKSEQGLVACDRAPHPGERAPAMDVVGFNISRYERLRRRVTQRWGEQDPGRVARLTALLRER
jgi:hypothetical protein